MVAQKVYPQELRTSVIDWNSHRDANSSNNNNKTLSPETIGYLRSKMGTVKNWNCGQQSKKSRKKSKADKA